MTSLYVRTLDEIRRDRTPLNPTVDDEETPS